ncbi:hypothetical protein [Synechococcus sp. UW179A]|uniref:hypothetical protein n=1 Tax=Synechococcus sp. UW179A TaxID=2575510 RepID=UPI000E0F7698|nr:hypothetical protein [Synechococcus sp. UW179A]
MKQRRVDAVPSGLNEEQVSKQLLDETVLAGDECRARNDHQICFGRARELVDAHSFCQTRN